MSYLKSKKQLEDLLAKRLGSLEILQSTLIRVEGAAGDVEVCAIVLLEFITIDGMLFR